MAHRSWQGALLLLAVARSECRRQDSFAPHPDDILCHHPWRSALGFRHWCRISRNSVGTTVLGGMIVSTVLNLFFIPVLYVIVKSILERNQPAMESTPQT